MDYLGKPEDPHRIIGSVMVVVSLGYAWVGKSFEYLVYVIQRVCVRPSDSYERVGLRAGPSRVSVVGVDALFVPLLVSVLHLLVLVRFWLCPQCDGLVLQVRGNRVEACRMREDADCVVSSSQVRTAK